MAQLTEAERGRQFARKATANDVLDKINKWVADGILIVDVVDAPGLALAVRTKVDGAPGQQRVRMTVRCDMEAAVVVGEVERIISALPVLP